MRLVWCRIWVGQPARLGSRLPLGLLVFGACALMRWCLMGDHPLSECGGSRVAGWPALTRCSWMGRCLSSRLGTSPLCGHLPWFPSLYRSLFPALWPLPFDSPGVGAPCVIAVVPPFCDAVPSVPLLPFVYSPQPAPFLAPLPRDLSLPSPFPLPSLWGCGGAWGAPMAHACGRLAWSHRWRVRAV